MLLASVAAAALGLAAPTRAAEAAPDNTDTTNSGGSTIAEVVVATQKRVQKLQDLPISMEVLSGAKLNSFNENNFRDIQNFVPNVFVESSAVNSVIHTRGFGSPPANYGFGHAVSLYEDGVYLERSKQPQTPFFDIDRVEVLRGPQGALFGKNTPAGAVSVVTTGPTDAFEGAITGLYNYDLKGYDITGFVAGSITSILSARLAVRVVDQDGYLVNLYTGDHDPRPPRTDGPPDREMGADEHVQLYGQE